jgi:hypothetical protein
MIPLCMTPRKYAMWLFLVLKRQLYCQDESAQEAPAMNPRRVSGTEEFFDLIAKRAEQRGKLRLEPDLHRTWDEARYQYPDAWYSPERAILEYSMYYAAGYIHPDEDSDAVLDRWLAKP